MLILGLNGWPEGGHNASAVVLKDGVPLIMVEEERVSRIKHGDGVAPHLGIKSCLDAANVGWEDFDAIAYGFDLHRLYQSVGREVGPLEDTLVPAEYWAAAQQPPLYQVPHHLAHAASAFLCSPFTSATIVVADGQGEVESTTIWHGDATGIHLLKSFGIHTSLGFFYDTVTELAGFGQKDSGKLMGLAPYGKSRPQIRAFKVSEGGFDVPAARGITRPELARFDEDHPIRDWWKEKLERYAEDGSNTFKNRDPAAAAQSALERVLMHLIRIAIGMTGERKVVLAGGVALNCSANGKIRRSGLVEELFIQPAAGDAGVSLGAALYLDWQRNKRRRRWTMEHAYLGCQFAGNSIKAAVKEFGYPMKELDEDRLVKTVAGMLDEGQIVGWFQGRAEVGPRALGNRSILADPRDPDMQDRVNVIKGRELWRPLAPSVPVEDFPKFFAGADTSPFMLLALPVNRQVRSAIPSVVHVDGSARPQSVSKETNPTYWALLRAWERESGVPVLLNTTFNLRGEPIVNSPRDALDSFSRSELDAVVIGDTLAMK